MRCPLCGREMTTLLGARRGRVSEIVHYCEVHGLLGRPSASILLSQVSSSKSNQLAYEDTRATESQSTAKGNDRTDPATNTTNQTNPRKQVPK
jgi:hypothetical protein